MKWGYKPVWSKKIIINARTDTVQDGTKKLWTKVKESSRCIVIVEGFYEWKDSKPWLVRGGNEELSYFAGLYHTVEDICYVSIVTCDSVGDMTSIHHRMPVQLLTCKEMDTWISPIAFSESKSVF